MVAVVVAVVVVVPYPAKKQINIDIFPSVGYLEGEEGGRERPRGW